MSNKGNAVVSSYIFTKMLKEFIEVLDLAVKP
jgi:hypothetical protein